MSSDGWNSIAGQLGAAMLPRDAERLADGLWRQLRPVLVAMVDAVLADSAPPYADSESEEAAYIAASAAAQLARIRAPRSRARPARHTGHRRASGNAGQQPGQRMKRSPNP